MATQQVVERVRDFLAALDLSPHRDRILLGLSGGIDSVTLYHTLVDLNYDVVCVHVNYGLRGDASDGDEKLVREVVPDQRLFVFTPEGFHKSQASIQEQARDYRFARFEEVADSEGIQWIALAHHSDDSAETVLMNMFRGTGIDGLVGIPSVRKLRSDGEDAVRVFRPFLGCTRLEIEQYATEKGYAWRQDESNSDPKYGRGFIRSQLRPLIEDRFGAAAFANVYRSSRFLREYRDSDLLPIFRQVSDLCASGDQKLDVERLGALDKVWQGIAIRDAMSKWCKLPSPNESIVDRILAMLDAQPGRFVELPGYRVVRERSSLSFLPDVVQEVISEQKIELGKTLAIDSKLLRADLLASRPEDLRTGSHMSALVDATAMPLSVRAWRSGDRIKLIGSDGTAKVSDVLTDRKVPSSRRARQLVVTGNDKIIWIPGVAQSDSYKILDTTSEVVLLTYIEA